jgi:ABC-type uncharacterized transport system permease subunit
VLSAVALWFTRQRRDADWAARAAGLILVCWTALFLRFLAFPMLADRLAIPIYLTLTATAIGVFFARASQAATMSPSELSP